MRGPKLPHWRCKCGVADNFANRTCCRGCAEAAPGHIQKKQKAAHAAAVSGTSPKVVTPKGPQGAWKDGPPKGGDWDRLFQVMEKMVDKAAGGTSPKPATAAAAGALMPAKEEDGEARGTRIQTLQTEVAQLLALGVAEGAPTVLERRAEISKLRSERPGHIQLRDVEGKIARIDKKLAAHADRRQEITEELEQLDKDKAEAEADKVRLEAEKVTLAKAQAADHALAIADIVSKDVRSNPMQEAKIKQCQQLLDELRGDSGTPAGSSVQPAAVPDLGAMEVEQAEDFQDMFSGLLAWKPLVGDANYADNCAKRRSELAQGVAAIVNKRFNTRAEPYGQRQG